MRVIWIIPYRIAVDELVCRPLIIRNSLKGFAPLFVLNRQNKLRKIRIENNLTWRIKATIEADKSHLIACSVITSELWQSLFMTEKASSSLWNFPWSFFDEMSFLITIIQDRRTRDAAHPIQSFYSISKIISVIIERLASVENDLQLDDLHYE